MSLTNLIYGIIFLVGTQSLAFVYAQDVPTLSICSVESVQGIDKLRIEGTTETDSCHCSLDKAGGTMDINIKVTNFTCTRETNEAPWLLLFYVDRCERAVVPCQQSWDSEGVQIDLPLELNEQQIDIEVLRNTNDSAPAYYSVAVNGTDMTIQFGLPAAVLDVKSGEDCLLPPPIEISICTVTTVRGTHVILQDNSDSGDCVCDIHELETSNGINLQIRNFSCTDMAQLPWNLMIYADGCKQPKITCEENWQSSMISFEADELELFLHLVKEGQDSQNISYEIDIFASNAVSIQCGFPRSILDTRKTCATTPFVTTGETVISSTSIQSSTSTMDEAQPTTSTSDESTSSAVGNGSSDKQTEDKNIKTGVLIGIIVGVVFLVLLIIMIVIIATRRRRDKRKRLQEEAQDPSNYSYMREIPGKHHQDTGDRQSNHSGKPSKTLTNGALHEKATSNHRNAVPKQDNRNNGGHPLDHVSPNSSRMDKSQRKASAKLKHLSTNVDDKNTVAYCNRIIDDEFDFINNDIYSGGLVAQ